MRKHDHYLCETAQLISAFVFATLIVKSLFHSYIQNFKLLACYCDCIGQFVSDLVGNPEDLLSRVKAHGICTHRKAMKTEPQGYKTFFMLNSANNEHEKPNAK